MGTERSRSAFALSYLLKIKKLPARFLRLNLHVGYNRIRRAFAAEDGESVQVFLFAFGNDVDAIIFVVVLHIANDIAFYGIAVHITTESYVEHATINPYVVGFCHRANFSPGTWLRAW